MFSQFFLIRLYIFFTKKNCYFFKIKNKIKILINIKTKICKKILRIIIYYQGKNQINIINHNKMTLM